MNPSRPLLPLCALAALLATGCERAAPPPKPAGPPLRVGAYYWPGEYCYDIAFQKGWFKDAGLNVEWVDTNPDYFGSFDQLVDGKLDVVAFSLFDFVLYCAKGKPLVAVGVSDYSHGAEALIARPGLARVADLRGRRLALSKNTYLEYIFTVVAQRDGLKPEDVTLVDVPGEKAPEALIKGDADAILTWEPLASQALQAVKGRKLFDTSEMSGTSGGLHTFRRQFVRERPADVQAFLSVCLRANEFMRQHPDEAYAIVAGLQKKTPAEVREFTRTDKVPDLRENLLAFSLAGGLDSLHGQARRINDFLIQKGLVQQKVETTEIFDSRFLRAVKNQE